MLGMRQDMRQLQKLAPQLIQSLRLLQLPTIELEQVIQQELETNPLLEETIDELEEELDEDAPVDDGSEKLDEDDEPLEPESADEQMEEELDTAWDEALDEFLSEDSYEQTLGIRREIDHSAELLERTPVYQESLADHLLEQLHMALDHEEHIQIGEYIIGNLDEDGFLTIPLEELAEELGVGEAEVEEVLLVIHTFEPAGVGARNLREALLIQLRELELTGTVAFRIIDDQYENLLKRRLQEIGKKLKVADHEITEALDIIRSLDPKPAASSFNAVDYTVIPDVVVERYEDEWQITLNDRFMPSLRISPSYKSLMQNSDSKEAKAYIRERLESANWLIKSIEQRRSTMLKVTRSIVERQEEFFEKGISHLKPMVLQEVADDIGMHVSTVSRVSNGKYAQTPQGVFELKFFFDGGLGSADGEDVSAKAVMNSIRQLIDGENSKKPFSDQAIADKLQEDGVIIARRTVAKYRDRMRIPPARSRKGL